MKNIGYYYRRMGKNIGYYYRRMGKNIGILLPPYGEKYRNIITAVWGKISEYEFRIHAFGKVRVPHQKVVALHLEQ